MPEVTYDSKLAATLRAVGSTNHAYINPTLKRLAAAALLRLDRHKVGGSKAPPVEKA